MRCATYSLNTDFSTRQAFLFERYSEDLPHQKASFEHEHQQLETERVMTSADFQPDVCNLTARSRAFTAVLTARPAWRTSVGDERRAEIFVF